MEKYFSEVVRAVRAIVEKQGKVAIVVGLAHQDAKTLMSYLIAPWNSSRPSSPRCSDGSLTGAASRRRSCRSLCSQGLPRQFWTSPGGTLRGLIPCSASMMRMLPLPPGPPPST
eukprot:6053105-Alexandrium_andersonii.AAC.1